MNKHGYEPFHVLELLDAGDKRAQSFFDRVNVREFEQSEVLVAEPMGGCFVNANTPDELRTLEEAFLEE